MRQLHYGKGYQYAHDAPDKLTTLQCLPDSLKDRRYYRPTDQGMEAQYGERLEQIRAWKEEHRDREAGPGSEKRPRGEPGT